MYTSIYFILLVVKYFEEALQFFKQSIAKDNKKDKPAHCEPY